MRPTLKALSDSSKSLSLGTGKFWSRFLYAHYEKLTDQDSGRVKDFIDANPQLVKVDLSGHNFSDAGIASLAASLARAPKLRQIEFSDNQIGDRGLIKLAEVITHNPNICKISISNPLTKVSEETVTALTKALKTNQSITDFNFEGAMLDDKAVEEFAKVTATHPNLTKLRINVADKDSAAIANFWQIIYENFRLTDASYQFMRHMPQVGENIIMRNRVLDNAIADFSAALLAPRFFRAARGYINSAQSNISTYQAIQELHEISRAYLLKGLTFSDAMEVSRHWRRPLCQEISKRLRDFGGKTWSSLFGAKELFLPPEIEEALGIQGWKLVARLSATELDAEGRYLAHCVAGYSSKCINGNSHIISIVDEKGKSVSTIEFSVDYGTEKLTLIQHRSDEDAEASEICKKIVAWFENSVETNEIKVDYQSLQEDLHKRQTLWDNPETAITDELGFNPFDNEKFRKLYMVYKKTMASDNLTFQQNFEKFKRIGQVSLHETHIGGEFEFALHQSKRPSLELHETASQLAIIPSLQKCLDNFFGDGVAKVTPLHIGIVSEIKIESDSSKLWQEFEKNVHLRGKITPHIDQKTGEQDGIIIKERLKIVRDWLLNEQKKKPKPTITKQESQALHPHAAKMQHDIS